MHAFVVRLLHKQPASRRLARTARWPLSFCLLLAGSASAQTHTKTELITYHDNTSEVANMPFASTFGTWGSSSDPSSLFNRPLKQTTISMGEGLAGHPIFAGPPPPPPPPPPCWETGECDPPLPCTINPVTGACDDPMRTPNPAPVIPGGDSETTSAVRRDIQSLDPKWRGKRIGYLEASRLSDAPVQRTSAAFTDQFFHRVNAFDAFMRPVALDKWSSLGHSKSETVEYQDGLPKWVVGQTRRITTNGIESMRVEFDLPPPTVPMITDKARG